MSATLPKPPTEISANGKEVWAWAAALSAATHRAHEIRTLRKEIRTREQECGACFWWMKSRDCPRETNVGGRRAGPSMKAPICTKFQMNAHDVEDIAKKKARLTELEAKP